MNSRYNKCIVIDVVLKKKCYTYETTYEHLAVHLQLLCLSQKLIH